MKQLIFPLIVLLVSVSVSGQSTQHPGYIVNIDHDTIHGMIHVRGIMHDPMKCHFSESGHTEVDTYSPEQLLSYRLNDGTYFASREVPVRVSLNQRTI
jgi:hypothetical protein